MAKANKTPELEPMNPDSEAIYDTKIAPLVAKIVAICKKHKIPMLASFQYCDESHPEGVGNCTTRIPFAGEHEKMHKATQELLRKYPSFIAMTTTSGV